MAIEFSSFLGDVNNTIYSIPVFNTILSNVVYTSIILSIILLIIIIFIYPSDDMTTSSMIKLFIYIFIANTVVFASYNSFISNKYKEKYMDHSSDQFMTNINKKGGNTVYADENIKVTPKFANTDVRIYNEENEHKEDYKNATTSDILDDLEQTI